MLDLPFPFWFRQRVPPAARQPVPPRTKATTWTWSISSWAPSPFLTMSRVSTWRHWPYRKRLTERSYYRTHRSSGKTPRQWYGSVWSKANDHLLVLYILWLSMRYCSSFMKADFTIFSSFIFLVKSILGWDSCRFNRFLTCALIVKDTLKTSIEISYCKFWI